MTVPQKPPMDPEIKLLRSSSFPLYKAKQLEKRVGVINMLETDLSLR